MLVLTAVADEEVAREAFKLGATAFLGKPCDLDLLQFTLEHAFAKRKPEYLLRNKRGISVQHALLEQGPRAL